MAYTAFEFQLIVVGALPSGENWSNTWTLDDNNGAGSRSDAITDLRQFYTDIKGQWANAVTASACTLVELANHTSFPVTWASIAGTSGANSLPTECSVRVSLDDLAGHRGGPFLPPGNINTVDVAGLITTAVQDQIADAVVALAANLSGHSLELRIDRPTVPSTVSAQRVRVGRVVDAIRGRRGSISESYDVRSL